MSENLSIAAILEKNKLHSAEEWILLVKISLTTGSFIRLAYSDDNITYDGDEYIAFAFELDIIGDFRKGELPQISLSVSNISRVIQYYLNEGQGGVGSNVTLMIVHSDHLDAAEPEVVYNFLCTECDAGPTKVNFTLSAPNPMRLRFPISKARKNVCRYRRFKDSRCGYSGAATECNRTYSRCLELDNAARYGGFLGVGKGYMYV